MSWRAVLSILRVEAPAQAEKIEARLLRDLGGLRITIPAKAKPHLRPDAIQKALRKHGWDVEKAAKELDVHFSTIYRHLAPKRNKQKHPDQHGTYNGRLIR